MAATWMSTWHAEMMQEATRVTMSLPGMKGTPGYKVKSRGERRPHPSGGFLQGGPTGPQGWALFPQEGDGRGRPAGPPGGHLPSWPESRRPHLVAPRARGPSQDRRQSWCSASPRAALRLYKLVVIQDRSCWMCVVPESCALGAAFGRGSNMPQ